MRTEQLPSVQRKIKGTRKLLGLIRFFIRMTNFLKQNFVKKASSLLVQKVVKSMAGVKHKLQYVAFD